MYYVYELSPLNSIFNIEFSGYHRRRLRYILPMAFDYLLVRLLALHVKKTDLIFVKILLEEVSLYNGRRLLIVKVIHPYLRPDLGILGKEFYQSGMGGGIQHILLIDNSGS